jgi:hypothetical protein
VTAADKSNTSSTEQPPKPIEPVHKTALEMTTEEYAALRRKITGREAPNCQYLGFTK